MYDLRIITGDAKGRRLISPQGRQIRPTSDRVKEAMFDILGDKVPDSDVLDLYAGTGSLGLEAISRGARRSVFIDINKENLRIVNENIKLLKYEKYCEVYNNDSFSGLNILKRRGIRFDIIFVDPPYHKGIVPDALQKIAETSVLKKGGIIVAEHDSRDEVPDISSNLIKHNEALDISSLAETREGKKVFLQSKNFLLMRYKSSVYGGTTISFYKMLEE